MFMIIRADLLRYDGRAGVFTLRNEQNLPASTYNPNAK